MNTMKDLRYIMALVLLCFAGIAGISAWPRSDTSVGYFLIGKNPYGVAIYQEGPHASVQFTNAQSFTVKNNTVTITPASTITYSRNDIIFDATGTIYTEPTQGQIDMLSRLLGKSLVKVNSPERVIRISVNEIYLVNPSIPGMLGIQGDSQISINRDMKTISFEQSVPVMVTIHDAINL